ncbi:MAG: hypothetical protein IJ629_07110 [Clostridia bacterium]|nr:hypothetical protein [Clostridia bacterium]
MAELVTKQKVKDYLDIGNKDLASEMKKKMERPDDWSDFKSELASLIEKFSKNPTQETRQQIDNLVSTHFVTNAIFGRDAVDRIFSDLGVRTEITKKSDSKGKDPVKENREAYRRAIFESLGIEYVGDTLERRKQEIQQMEDEKYGIVRRGSKSVAKTERITRGEETEALEAPEGEEEPQREDGKFKKSLKNAYFKLTASVLMAPGEVPPEILQENRELITETSEKLDKVIIDLREAHRIIVSKNTEREAEIPEELKDAYQAMRDGKMDEETLEAFEVTLKQRQSELLDGIAGNFDKLLRTKLETELRALAESKFADMPKEEVDAEIEYAMQDAKVDKDGKLVLPGRSIFRDVFFDEKGEVVEEHADLVGRMTTYSGLPKIYDLSKKELRNLAKNFGDLSKMDPSSKSYAIAQALHEHPEMLMDGADSVMQEIRDAERERFVTRGISEEAELSHKIMVASEIRGQFDQLNEIVMVYDMNEASNGEIDRNDSRKREIALKIARKKVEALEKAGLSKVIGDGEKARDSVIKRAKKLLLPGLENARETGNRRFQKEFEDSEHDEPAE